MGETHDEIEKFIAAIEEEGLGDIWTYTIRQNIVISEHKH